MSEARSNLERHLREGKFILAAEITPPQGPCDPAFGKSVTALKSHVDVINITDNPMAKVHMASWAASILVQAQGVETVYQMTVRDRNRLALQSDLFGCNAMGIRNVLCLSGDHPALGDHPEAKPVYDLDSLQWLNTLSRMRADGTQMNGKPLAGKLDLFIGAAANPFAEPLDYRVKRFAKKVAAGADFIMTQAVFDLPQLERWLREIEEAGLAGSVYIIVGILPVTSPKTLRYLQKKVPGMMIPDRLVNRMQQADDHEVEGVAIAAEHLARIRNLGQVHGVLFMSSRTDLVPEILETAGFNSSSATPDGPGFPSEKEGMAH